MLILAASIAWTLTMQSPQGPQQFGPFESLHLCQVEAARHYAVGRARKWGASVCSAGKYSLKFNEKTLPPNLRAGKNKA